MNPDVDAYIAAFPEEVRQILTEIRARILKVAPDAVESMSYGMPAYKTHGRPLVYMAGYAKHIGFYATPTGHEAFAADLATYKQGRGSVQFPLNRPIPYELIERIVAFRAEENRG